MRFIFAFFLYLLLIPNHAIACSCSGESYTENSSLENILTADFVIKASLINAYPRPFEDSETPPDYFSYPMKGNPLFQKLDLEVLHVYKGDKNLKKLSIYLDTGSSCGWPYQSIEELGQYFKDRKILIVSKSNGVFYLPTACGGNYVSDKHREEILSGQFDFSRKLESKAHPIEQVENFYPANFKAVKSVVELNEQIEIAKQKDATYQFRTQKLTFKEKPFLFLIETQHYDEKSVRLMKELGLWDKSEGELYAGKIIGSAIYLYEISDENLLKFLHSHAFWSDANVRVKDTDHLVISGKENPEDARSYSISDILGQSCLEDEHCLDGNYCLRNDYFKPRGLCSPCAELAAENRPASCQ